MSPVTIVWPRPLAVDAYAAVGRDLRFTLTTPGRPGAESVAFSPDGATLAVGDYDGSTYLWKTANQTS